MTVLNRQLWHAAGLQAPPQRCCRCRWPQAAAMQRRPPSSTPTCECIIDMFRDTTSGVCMLLHAQQRLRAYRHLMNCRSLYIVAACAFAVVTYDSAQVLNGALHACQR